jgi:hypothetical protein
MFSLGDLCLNWNNIPANVCGIICFLIGNVILGISLILGHSKAAFKSTYNRIFSTIAITLVTIIISCVTAIILSVIFKVSNGIVIGCFIYLVSHGLFRFFITLLPYSPPVVLASYLGSLLYQTCDVLVLIDVLKNTTSSSFSGTEDVNYLKVIYMSLYYVGLIIICITLLIAHLLLTYT